MVSRECESAWCVKAPTLPWDALLGVGSAAEGAFWGILNGFIEPQLPTSPAPTTANDDGDDDDSEERALPDPDMESGLLPGGEHDQCQNSPPDMQPKEVSFFFI